MNLTRSLYGLGGWCVRHGWLVVLLWLLFLGGVNALDRFLPAPAERAFVLEGTGSAAAQTLLNRAFPGSAAQPAPLVLHRQQGWDDPSGQALLAEVEAGVAALDDVNAVTSPRTQDGLLSADRSTALVLVQIDERLGGDLGVAQEIQDVAEQVAGGEGADVALGGYLGSVISQPDTKRSEAIGLALAAVVLLVTLRRGWPVLVPFVTAIAAVGSGLAIVGLLERVTFIPDEATILGTMLGLGVGIDYALFLVTRHRMLLRRGFDVPESAARTAGTAGAAMVFAGGTLIAAVSGLVLTGISFLAWLGFAAAVIVAIAVAAALTLVPALLGILGERVLPRRWQGERTDAELDNGRWARIADAVTRRPWTSAILATSLLLALAAPTLAMTFGQNDGRAFPPDSPAYRSTVLIEDGFGPGRNGPLVVAAQLYTTAVVPDGLDVTAVQGDPRGDDPRLVAVGEALAADPGVASVTAPVVSTDGGVAVWQVVPTTGPADPATQQLVERLRDDLLPQVTDGQAMAAYVGGVTAARSDLSVKVQERLEPFVLGVVLLSFLLMLVAYRSLVIPLKAAVMNLLSIAAAYGVVVMVFQLGWGASAIGLDGPVPIESFVPMMMFAVLFGLSMDYEVFLLTSFREHWERTGDVAVAVRRALADTGQVITSAALIMVGVFASFVLAEQAIAKMFGIGLATAVALDATLVRCVLVPSIMVLAARGTFWLPDWLDRLLPRVHVEGDPAAAGLGRARRTERLIDPAAPAARLTAVAVAVGVAWFVGTRLDGSGAGAPFADVAVAICVAAGAVAAWLPRGLVGAGDHLALRLLALVSGGLVTALAYGVGSALVPPVEADAGRLAGAALLACAAVAVVPGVRRYGLVVLLGGAGVAVTVAVAAAASAVGAGAAGAAGGQVGAAVLPAVLAFVLVRVVEALLLPAPDPAPSEGAALGSAPSEGAALGSAPSEGAALGSAPSEGAALGPAPSEGAALGPAPSEGAALGPAPSEGAAARLAPVGVAVETSPEEAVSR